MCWNHQLGKVFCLVEERQTEGVEFLAFNNICNIVFAIKGRDNFYAIIISDRSNTPHCSCSSDDIEKMDQESRFKFDPTLPSAKIYFAAYRRKQKEIKYDIFANNFKSTAFDIIKHLFVDTLYIDTTEESQIFEQKGFLAAVAWSEPLNQKPSLISKWHANKKE